MTHINEAADAAAGPSLRISSFTISDGTLVRPPSEGTIVFVGPNNSGKSQSLRDIYTHLRGEETQQVKAVTSAELGMNGDQEMIHALLDLRGLIKPNSAGASVAHLPRMQVGVPGVYNMWNAGRGAGPLVSFFVLYADADTRLQAASGIESFDPEVHAPSIPLHVLYGDVSAERNLAALVSRAFGTKIAVDRYSSQKIYLRVGEPPDDLTTPPTTEYVVSLRRLQTIKSVRDGMRAFVGLALHMIAGEHSVVLVDEPEAFLHPPQAELIGRVLASERTIERQVFVSPHSTDVLRGILSTSDFTTIVRLTHDGDVNLAHVLDADDVQRLWEDPLLRYSNLLDALFHEFTVLCESDADCRFYGSIFDRLSSEVTDDDVEGRAIIRPFFTHCGGKHRMPTVIRALRAVGVPVHVIEEFDVLRDQANLKGIVEALSGDWQPIDRDQTIIRTDLDQRLEAPSVTSVKQRLEEIFSSGEASGGRLSTGQSDLAREVLRTRSGWERAKESGATALGSGDPASAWLHVNPTLREMGLYVVPVGELERFVPQVGGHGSRWVSEVHGQGLHLTLPLTDALDFVRSFADYSSASRDAAAEKP